MSCLLVGRKAFLCRAVCFFAAWVGHSYQDKKQQLVFLNIFI